MKAKYSSSPRTIANGESTTPLCSATGVMLVDGTTSGGGASATNQTTEITALNMLTQPRTSATVTASDSTDLTGIANKGLWVGTAGNLSIKLAGDSAATTWKNVPSGTYVPGNVIRVMAATTAADIVALGGTG